MQIYSYSTELLGVFPAMCSMWGIKGVWKSSGVIRMDKEAKVEEEEAVEMATALV